MAAQAQAQAQNKIGWVQHDIDVGRSSGYADYVSALTVKQVVGRTSVVVGCTLTGAGIGAAVGSSACGIGAVPGAAIGAGVGFVVGVSGCAIYDCVHLRKWKNQLTEEGLKIFQNKILDVRNNDTDTDYICPILLIPPAFPVRVRGYRQVYEASALGEAISRNGRNPVTAEFIDMDDVVIAYDGYTRTAEICHDILTNHAEGFDERELQGLRILYEGCKKSARVCFDKETQQLMKLAQQGELTPLQLAERTAALATLLQPVIG